MEIKKNSTSSLLGGITLVAGTCIGGGMLALPVETAEAGLVPSLVVMFVAWVFMLMTGLLLSEATLWVKTPHPHLVTMSQKFLGSSGRFLSILLVFFMGIGSLVAYTTAGGPILQILGSELFSFNVDPSLYAVIFASIFGLVFLFQGKWVTKINQYLVYGLAITFLLILIIGFGHFKKIEWVADFSKIPVCIPLILTTFSYQIMVPSLVEILQRDRNAIYKAIFFGSLIPLFIYQAYQIVVFGIVPLEGDMGLLYALKNGLSSTEVLYYHTKSGLLAPIVNAFAFFSIVTSFIGIGLGLVGFVRDLFHLNSNYRILFAISLSLILSTLFFTFLIPNAFLTALDMTGGYGDTWLSGLIPIGMCWVGRHIFKIEEGAKQITRKWILAALALFALIVMYMQTYKLLYL